jgi:hypothetical protein
MSWYWWVTIFAGTPFVLAVGMLLYMRFFQPANQLGLKHDFESSKISLGDKVMYLLFWPEIVLLEKVFYRILD